MKKIDQLTNQYSVSKTLRFKLIPIGETEKYFTERQCLERDENLSKSYESVKQIIKEYHRFYIDDCLATLNLDGLEECYSLYVKTSKSPDDYKRIEALKANMKCAIFDKLTKDIRYKKIISKELIKEILPEYVSEEKKELVNEFKNFTTYFVGFNDNLKNVYSNENKSTEITYRLIEQNLNKFFDNCKLGDSLKQFQPETLQNLKNSFSEIIDVENIFKPKYFNTLLTQKGMDLYNNVIGGYTLAGGEKVKGINEYINEYSQTKRIKLPKFKQLYKQVLSIKTTLSFLDEKFNEDLHVINGINEYNKILKEKFEDVDALFKTADYEFSQIYIRAEDIALISQRITGAWDTVRNCYINEYDAGHSEKEKKNYEKYEEKRNKYFNAIKAYSLQSIFDVCGNEQLDRESFLDYYRKTIANQVATINNNYETFSILNEKSKLLGNEHNTELAKNYLDSVKELKDTLSVFDVNNDEAKDPMFYGIIDDINLTLKDSIPLYNRTRNFLTQKTYSNDKIKLNFNNAQLFNGWDTNKEVDYSTVLFRKGDKYYVGIINPDSKKIFENCPTVNDGEDCYEKMIYRLLPGPNKMLPKVIFAPTNDSIFCPPQTIVEKYKRGTHKTGSLFNLQDCHNLIDYFKSCIPKYASWRCFNFHFSATSTYKNIADFYREVSEQGYKITFTLISEKYIEECVAKGKLYLFQIYNKDFSEYRKGKKNLHTIYFEHLFSDENLKNPLVLLNGGAEMFYRPASTKIDPNYITHPKNQPLKNKNPLSEKKISEFTYDLIKDKRYTKPQFSFHVPIKINAFDGDDYRNKLNPIVRSALRQCTDNYVIGIDRGERNLIYVSVVDGSGNIIEQFSGNIIENEYKDNIYRTDYHALLTERADERDKARKSWKAINGIADLKRGYLSQIVHKICLLVEKYDAVIALEDLNGGFKNSRKKFEKSTYQEFEKQLIDKLNLLVFKDKQPNECGGIRKAYQLVDKFKSFSDMRFQNGIIFYVPAWNTSNIDPTTGFVNLLRPKYTSVESARDFFTRFKNISYEQNMFKFEFNYKNFPKCDSDFKKEWTVYSNGDRIEAFIDKETNKKDGRRTVYPTEMLKKLLAENGIEFENGRNLIAEICDENNTKAFYEKLLHIFSLILQMRNSNSITGEDYIISPVKNKVGEFYDSRKYAERTSSLPIDADANGAYNIARKGLWAINQIKSAADDEFLETKISISNKEWLEFVQKNGD